MKKIILMLALMTGACKKENFKTINSSSNEQLLSNTLTFNEEELPKRKFMDSSEHYLLGDSFYVNGTCTINNITITAANFGGTTFNTKLLIDGIAVDTIYIPANGINEGEYKFSFSPNVSLNEGGHLLQFKGNSYGMDSTNVYFTIFPGDVITNANVINLPVQKMRIYNY